MPKTCSDRGDGEQQACKKGFGIKVSSWVAEIST